MSAAAKNSGSWPRNCTATMMPQAERTHRAGLRSRPLVSRVFLKDTTVRRLSSFTLREEIAVGTILLIILILLLLGSAPAWPHSRNWGYGPSGGIGLLLVILIVLLLMGRI